MLYWVFKWVAFAPLVRLLFHPWVEGEENIPESGGAIIVANHISAGDTFLLPSMIKRRVTFLAKAELFAGRGLKGLVLTGFLRSIGQQPLDRSGGRASAADMSGILSVIHNGGILGIFPEGTRSPDGRLYKGKTGVARLVLQAGVPVIPVALVNTQLVPSRIPKIPTMRRPGIRVGPPLDFTRYAGSGSDRAVLRYVTDEIMYAVMKLSGQTYVDMYGSSVKAALEEGRAIDPPVRSRPGLGQQEPPAAPSPVTRASA